MIPRKGGGSNMKKKPVLFLLAFPVLLLAACGTNPGSSANTSSSGQIMENLPFTDIGETESDAKYTFASSLAEKESLYPLSKGQSYYFSSSYANNGDGSIESPFNSLDKLKGVTLGAGVSILLKCGDTFLGNIAVESIKGDDDNPITFASYGDGERPIIQGPSTIGDVDSLRSTVLFEKCSNIVVRDLKIKVYGPDRSAYPGNSYVGISFNYNFSKGEKFKNLYAINNVVEGNGVSSNTWGITLNSVESSPSIAPHKIVDNVNFKYNEAYGFGRSGIHSGGWLNSSPKNGNNSFMLSFSNSLSDGWSKLQPIGDQITYHSQPGFLFAYKNKFYYMGDVWGGFEWKSIKEFDYSKSTYLCLELHLEKDLSTFIMAKNKKDK